ncbi:MULTISPECIES: MucR family transcriptional regulator [unclassified Mesorhizobium]|uniref:MucR family transcriptional regulator n=1 Tax=unclassified Mesorhizobium TaxID=325217 RepID=UPI000FCC14E8|nr:MULTISPECIES: MucR family transcriptional regulator [unclassified Mesorhizobium]RUY28895.1 transcriptional regulator [Mesorhizobium sp. M7A.F.Ca.US.001.04.2.1]RUY42439.1 transcriptional regulator [Mesorhizobium sp. M7A.F.Ca.US.001.04.1.1]RVA07712.1 transcriptional regulator [Mesorhizobium sp. M7A.F.Ca.US.001.02.1.1]RVA15311.1 transcriptional regulator [Mesorhizobium sp. M7A.F.Ca.US.002.01.1.1]
MTDEIERNTALIELTADIVAAFVQNNAVPVAGLPDLISSVNAALSKLGPTPVAELPPLTPAVNPKKSIFPDYIISLEDGRKFKSMKRHLGLLGMTPEQYRTKWGLPRDYPMVAPSYAAQRSKLAKSIGLGLKPATKDPAKKAPAKKPAPKGIKAKGAKRNLTRNA